MTLDLAMSADDRPRLDLDEGADPRPVADRAAVEVGEGVDDDALAERAVAQEPERGVVGGSLGGHGRTTLGAEAAAASPEDARRAALELERWGTAREWRGRDPYDALNGRRARLLARTPLTRRLVIQLAKRSPIDLSRPLGVPRGENANTIAHVLSAYARSGGARLDELGFGGAERTEWAIDRLEALRAPGYEEPCWGYHFDVETRFFFYSRETPNTIATSFAGLALLAAASERGSARARELAEGVGEFLLRRIELTPARDGRGGYLGYFPGDRTPIHNASLLAASVLAGLHAAGGRAEYAEVAGEAVAFALAHQRPDGSWPYAESEVGGWVDNFHTGYVLDSLLRCALALGDARALAAWRRGLAFFRERLFDPGGVPRFTTDRTHPIDGQCVAQSIESFALGARLHPELLDDARAVLGYGLRSMRRRDGAFAFQRHRLFVNRAPHVRWVEAPMLSALVSLCAAAPEAA